MTSFLGFNVSKIQLAQALSVRLLLPGLVRTYSDKQLTCHFSITLRSIRRMPMTVLCSAVANESYAM